MSSQSDRNAKCVSLGTLEQNRMWSTAFRKMQNQGHERCGTSSRLAGGFGAYSQNDLRRAAHAASLSRDGGTGLTPRLMDLFSHRYDAILAAGLAYHNAQPPLTRPTAKEGLRKRGRKPRRTGHNIIARLMERKEDVLRFLVDPTVPFTNNQAERDIRMMKLRQKISGGFRSDQGAENFATIRSFISTTKKQGWKIIEALTANPQALIGRLRLA